MAYTEDKKGTGLDALTGAQVTSLDVFLVSDESDSGNLKKVAQSEMLEALDVTASAAEINILDGATLSTAELNQLDGVTLSGNNTGDETTSSIKSKLGISVLSGDNTGDQDLSSYATKAYADALVVGLIDDRGNYDASGNTFPASGGSGTAGAVLKGDLWTISVAGTLGGNAVTAGDLIRALVDSPAQTSSNWAITENNIGYVAENASNKDTDGTLSANSDTKYASQKATKTYADSKVDNTAYDASTWNGVTDKAPSKDAVRDKFASIDSTLSGLSGSLEVLNAATLSSTQNDYATGMNTSANILTIIPIIPSSSFKFTGFDATGVENGKRIRFYNQSDRLTSSGRIILFERLFSGSGSAATNRIMFPLYNGMPLILTPDSYVDFEYRTFDDYWHFVGASEWGNPNMFFDCYSDCHVNAPFIPTTATAGTVAANSGSILSNTTQKTIGTMLHTITTNAGRAYLGTQASAMYFGGYCALGMARVQFGALADATDDYVSYNLFTDASGGAPVDQIAFVYNRSQSTDWRTSTINNSTENIKTVTGFTPSTTVFQYIGAFVNGDSTNVDFFYSADGDTWTFATSHQSTETSPTNIPTGTSRTLGFMTGFSKTAGSGSKTMNTDWLGYKLMMKRGV